MSEKTKQPDYDAVDQYYSMTVRGNFIKEWPSATSVSEGGYSQTMVSNVCRQTQLTAHGFLWKYKDDERPILEWIQLNNNRKSAGKPAKPVY